MSDYPSIRGTCPNCGTFLFTDDRKYLVDHAPLTIEESCRCFHCGAELKLTLTVSEDREIECTIKGRVPED